MTQVRAIVVALVSLGVLFMVAPFHVLAQQAVKLPAPSLTSDTSLEKAIAERRSVRSYKKESLQLSEVGQIVWAAQGITDPVKVLRAAPSPRAAYLIKIYLVAADVAGLNPGIYRYEPKTHELVQTAAGGKLGPLYDAAGQGPIKGAPAVLVVAGDMARGSSREWAFLEAGHVAENVYLQCVSLKMATVSMAGFKADQVKKALGLPDKDEVIYLMPLGKK